MFEQGLADTDSKQVHGLYLEGRGIQEIQAEEREKKAVNHGGQEAS